MRKWLRVGIIILIIGISLLAGTIYRSNTTTSFADPRVDMAPNSWSYVYSDVADQTLPKIYEFLLAPREFQLEVQATSPVDVYILDSEGIMLWNKDKTVDPVFTFKEAQKDTYTFELFNRDKYTVVMYNPTDENVTSRWIISVYGIEKDLIYLSVVIIAAGLGVTAVSVMISGKQQSKIVKK